MSELSDAIRAAGVQNVAAAISADSAFRVFNLTWSEPEQIIPACEKLGLRTLESVLQWVAATNAAVGDTAAFEALVDPVLSVSLDGMKKTAWPELHKSIHATGLLSSDCLLHNSDGQYHLPTKAQLDLIAKTCPSTRHKWRNEILDCDDFVRVALGWLSGRGLGNIAAAFAATRAFSGGATVGGHAVVLVWDDTLTPWQWEPQAGTLCPVSHAKLGGNFLATRVEYARIFA